MFGLVRVFFDSKEARPHPIVPSVKAMQPSGLDRLDESGSLNSIADDDTDHHYKFISAGITIHTPRALCF